MNEHIKGYKHELYTVAFIILSRIHICIVYLWPWKYTRLIWPWPLNNCYIFIILCETNIVMGTNTNFILLDSWFSVESYAELYIIISPWRYTRIIWPWPWNHFKAFQFQCIPNPLLNKLIKGYKNKLYTAALIILCKMHICIVYLWPWKYTRPIWPWPLYYFIYFYLL